MVVAAVRQSQVAQVLNLKVDCQAHLDHATTASGSTACRSRALAVQEATTAC
jgi:hypothetical protein